MGIKWKRKNSIIKLWILNSLSRKGFYVLENYLKKRIVNWKYKKSDGSRKWRGVAIKKSVKLKLADLIVTFLKSKSSFFGIVWQIS